MTDQIDPFAAFAGLTLSFLEDSLGVYYIGCATLSIGSQLVDNPTCSYVFASVGFGFTFFRG
jgi:hypothetical protein